MPGLGIDLDPRVRQPLGDKAGRGRRHDPVAAADEHQGRHRDLAQALRHE
jgi:hypothetical protein